jgi:hypothetical protein
MPVNPSGVIGNILGRNKYNGAPISRQQQWQHFSEVQKIMLRKRLKDSDHDGVPDYYDCRPRDRRHQEDGSETWRVEFSDGSYLDVVVDMGSSRQTIITNAKLQQSYNNKYGSNRIIKMTKIYNG